MSSETSLKFARLLSAEEREFSRVFFKTREDIVDFIRVHRDNYPDRHCYDLGYIKSGLDHIYNGLKNEPTRYVRRAMISMDHLLDGLQVETIVVRENSGEQKAGEFHIYNRFGGWREHRQIVGVKGSRCLPRPDKPVVIRCSWASFEFNFDLESINKESPAWKYIYRPSDDGVKCDIVEVQCIVTFLAPHPNLKFKAFVKDEKVPSELPDTSTINELEYSVLE